MLIMTKEIGNIDVLKTSNFQVQKFRLQISFCRAPTHADIQYYVLRYYLKFRSVLLLIIS